MSSVLSSFFSRDPRTSFAYELPTDPFVSIATDIFVGKSCKKSELREKATCFWSSSPNSTLKTQAQKLKCIRHPNVLTYIDSLEVENTYYLITESCRPLAYYLSESKLTDTQRELLVSWGFYQLLNCIKFLHNEAKLSQNNLCNAIFITSSGDWKLGAFHLSAPLSSPQKDMNDLASVLVQIFSKNFTGDQLIIGGASALQQIPKRLHTLYKRLNVRGRNVMAVADILNECRSVGGFMKNKFVDTLLFLDEFQIRDAAEKQSFFVHLNTNLELFPDDIARNKILPKLIHTYEYGDAGAHILVPMFKLGRLLDEDEYQQKIVPCLVKLFSSTDRTTRVKLLERIDEFAGHLKPQIVNEKIYSNLVTGFLDSNVAVRESTVKAIVTFAEKLNYANLNTDLMKYLARLQGSDPEPSIRTNTTICLGKIGCFIDPSHRQRILISAFTRALKDPFPPARMAGVIALSATQQYYSISDVALRVLPSLALLTIDPEKQVRDHSFKAIGGFLEKLQKASDNPELIPEIEAQVNAGGKGGLLSADKVPQWAGWAMKAISGKFYKSTAKEQSPPQQQPVINSGENKEQNSTTKMQINEKQQQQQTKKPMELKESSPFKTLSTKRTESFSSSQSSISAKGATNSSVAVSGWGELLDEDVIDDKHARKEDSVSDGSDWDSAAHMVDDGGVPDGKNESGDDALWSVAMDHWESVQDSSTKPKPVAASNTKSKPNADNRLNSSSTTTATTTTAAKPKTALKLSAVRKKQIQQAIDNDLNMLLGSAMGIGDESKQKIENEPKEFTAAAKQFSQPKKEEQPQPKTATSIQQKQQKKESTVSDWQSW